MRDRRPERPAPARLDLEHGIVPIAESERLGDGTTGIDTPARWQHYEIDRDRHENERCHRPRDRATSEPRNQPARRSEGDHGGELPRGEDDPEGAPRVEPGAETHQTGVGILERTAPMTSSAVRPSTSTSGASVSR